jgi:hypothetical protein
MMGLQRLKKGDGLVPPRQLPEPELMLDGDDVDVRGVQPLGGSPVARGTALLDPPPDFRPVLVRGPGLVDGRP